MIDINLLVSSDLLTLNQKLFKKNLGIVCLVLTMVVIFGGTIIFGVDQLSLARLREIKSHRQELQDQFSNDLPKLEMLLSLKDKLAGIRQVISTRPNLSAAISRQQATLSPGITMSNFTVNSDGNMDFDVKAANFKILSDYLTKLETEKEMEFFKQLKISSLQMGKDGSFAFSIFATFDKNILLEDDNK